MTTRRGFRAWISVALMTVCVAAGVPAGAQDAQDVPGSRDILVSRLPGYHVCDFEERDFDRETFSRGAGDDVQEVPIEGHVVRLGYCLTSGTPQRSMLQIYRNYETVLKQLGATMAFANGQYDMHATLTKDGRETWLHLVGNEYEYRVVVAEKGGMLLELATAADLLAALNNSGHVALLINFDTAKATLRPDAKPVIDQIIALMRENPTLRIQIEGHTDNAGTAASNKTLSEARARTVLNALVAGGIPAARMTAAGFGQERPIAPNSDDAGRTKNRRVELVKLSG